MKYDIAAGMDNTTLNSVLKQVYKALYPTVFKQKLDIKKLIFDSVEMDINEAPVAALVQSALLKSGDLLGTLIKDEPALAEVKIPEESKKHLQKLLTASMFNIELPNVLLGINFTGGKSETVNTSINCSVNVKTSRKNNKNILTIIIVSGTLKIKPSKPELEATLNEYVVPVITGFLNETLLKAIEIPALEYGKLGVSMPVPVVSRPYFTAYSCIGNQQADIPAAKAWPTDCIYISLNNKAMMAAASIPFPIGPTEGFSWGPFSGNVTAQVTEPDTLIINGDGGITATITAVAKAQLEMHNPWYLPDISFGPRARAQVTAIFKPSVVNGKLLLAMQSPPIPYFSFDWGFPTVFEYLLYPLIKGLTIALNALIGPLISKIFQLPPFEIFTLPLIDFTVLGKKVTIKIDQATTSSLDSAMLIKAKATVS